MHQLPQGTLPAKRSPGELKIATFGFLNMLQQNKFPIIIGRLFGMALRRLRGKDGGGGCKGQGEEGIQDYDNAPTKLRFGKSFFLKNRKGHTASLCNFPGPAYRGKQLNSYPVCALLDLYLPYKFRIFLSAAQPTDQGEKSVVLLVVGDYLSISHVQFFRGV